MLLTNIVLVLAFIGMIGIAVWLTRDESAKGSTGAKRGQVRIVDADSDEER
jgi:hypothetical protein